MKTVRFQPTSSPKPRFTPGKRHRSQSLRAPAFLVGFATFLLSMPASALVTFDLHYQGLDEIDLGDVPAGGEITLDLDIYYDGGPLDLHGIGASVFFDPARADFLGGTRNTDVILGETIAVGDTSIVAGGLPSVWDPLILGLAHHPGSDLWPINQVSTVSAISLDPAPRGTETLASHSLTFSVHDIVTFDVTFGQGDALVLRDLLGQVTVCGRGGSGADITTGECIDEGLVEFDGFRITSNGVAAPTPVPIFDTEPDPDDTDVPDDTGDTTPPDDTLDRTPPDDSTYWDLTSTSIGGSNGPVSGVPEPTSALLFGAGLVTAALGIRRPRSGRAD